MPPTYTFSVWFRRPGEHWQQTSRVLTKEECASLMACDQWSPGWLEKVAIVARSCVDMPEGTLLDYPTVEASKAGDQPPRKPKPPRANAYSHLPRWQRPGGR